MNHALTSDRPELVFGLVGPIGVDMSSVEQALSASLKQVEYTPIGVHLTQEVPQIFPHLSGASGKFSTFQDKINTINELREGSGRVDILALLSILKIIETRKSINKSKEGADQDGKFIAPATSTAYIIRQLKRAEEIRTLTQVYGKRFIQVSVTIGEEQQRQSVKSIVASENPSLKDDAVDAMVRNLIATDQHEATDPFGQRLSDTFHTGDVFIDGSSDQSIRADCQRFIDAIFGMNSISPTIDEFGSYMAKVASLRSIDMSRQVGSSIMSPEGDIISIGCNEVPRPGGGNYWCSDPSPQRDIDRKIEANKLETSRIIHSFVEVIHQHGSLKKEPSEVLSDPTFQELIKQSPISDITEFGRMTHAEMSALSDAARLGRSTKGATIYVTTYPCHNCAKHLIAVGIKRIVYVEPYPKSRALSLHDDALTHEERHCSKVSLEHFHGISPRRFRDIFEKSKRKGKDNKPNIWYEGSPTPLVGERFSTHVYLEPTFLSVLNEAIGKLNR